MAAKPARKIFTKVEKSKYTEKPNIILEAVDQLVEFVAPTLGPKIRHVLVDMGYRTELMDDGVSIAEEFELEDEFQDAVVAYVREAAKKTDDGAGDGTTSTMVMLRRLLALALSSGKTYPEVRRELEAACAKAVEELKANSVPCDSEEMLHKVALTSMDDQEAAKVVSEVVWKTGAKGAVTITDFVGRGVEYERLEGFTMGRGMIHRGMVNDRERQLFVAPTKDFAGPVAVAIVENLISVEKEITPILQAAEDAGVKNLAIFCPNLIGEALGIAALGKVRGAFNIVAIPLPGQGEKMKDYVDDLRLVTGATAPAGEFEASNLGMAESIRVSFDDTTVIGGKGDPASIQAVVAKLQSSSDSSKDDYEKEYLHQRQARLMGGVVMIKVGGVTETQTRLRLKKVEDAVNACKCALEEGVSPGAGMALASLSSGSDMLDAALAEIASQVFDNAEITDEQATSVMEQSSSDRRTSLNVLTGEVGDFLKIGVVDATKVLRTALENAVSIATILYSTSGIITSKRPE